MKIDEIIKKLNFKEKEEEKEIGTSLNAPKGIQDEFTRWGFISKLKANSKNTILFVKNKSDFDKNFENTIGKIGYDSVFWIAYPKGTSKIKSDVNRDILWKIILPVPPWVRVT